MLLITGIPLHARVRSEFARSRLTEATFDAAMDALHPVLHEVTSVDERTWLRNALTRPLHRTVESALDVLAGELARALEGAPASLRGKIEEAPRWQASGWE